MDLVKVKVINDDLEFDVPAGERIMDYLPDGCSLMFGCREGSCGICTCTIRNGENLLVTKSHIEEETLNKVGGLSNQRLCCQLWVKGHVKEGEIEMEY